jgi:hypothetical protein
MATLAMGAPAQDDQQQGGANNSDTAETSVGNPKLGEPEKRLDAQGIDQQMRTDLVSVRRQHKMRWSTQRRAIVREILRMVEYLKGNQYYNFDSLGFNFYDPFNQGGTAGSQQGQDDVNVYRRVTNIIQWAERVLVSSLTAELPITRFWPGNASSDLDNKTAQDGSRANALIERQNNVRSMVQQAVSYLAVAGSYWRHTRFVRDSRLIGSTNESYETETMQQREIMAARYICPSCGEDTPAEGADQSQATNCQGCGGPVGQQDYFPALSMEMPVVGATNQAPAGRVKQNLYNGLHVDVAPDLDDDNMISATPILDLTLELDKGAMRDMYPGCWSMFAAEGDTESTSGEADFDRTARLRALAPATSSWLMKSSASATSQGTPSYSRCWITTQGFKILDDQKRAEALCVRFPKGCLLVTVNERVVDVQERALMDEWTWNGTKKGLGPYPPPILQAGMDLQDTVNDTGNTLDEFYDRCASPGGFADSRYLGKGLNGRYLPPGSWIPVKINPELGQDLSKAFFQPDIRIEQNIHKYRQDSLQLFQLLLGITPQMWGGTQPNVDTAAGQEQALKVASGIMQQYWERIREETAAASKLAIKCLANNATEDLFHVTQDQGPGGFKNEPIDIQNLQGDINAYPEADQGYPVGFDQQRQLFLQMVMEGAQNPLVMEWFKSLKNRRTAARYIMPGDTEIVGEDDEFKTMQDIQQLIQGAPTPAPIPGPDGQPIMLPSVMPDKDMQDLEIASLAVKAYAIKNYAQLIKNPNALENLRAYLRIAAQFQAETQIQEQGPPPPPPGAGKPPAQKGVH